MTYNKKCFYKSLKHDYTKLGIIGLGVIILILGVLGWRAYGNVIVGAFSFVPASLVVSLLTIGLSILSIYDFCGSTKASILQHSSLCIIGVYITLNILFLFAIFIVYGMMVQGMVGVEEGDVILNACFNESIYAMVFSCIMLAVGLPPAIAYVKCKEDESFKNDMMGAGIV